MRIPKADREAVKLFLAARAKHHDAIATLIRRMNDKGLSLEDYVRWYVRWNNERKKASAKR